MKKYKAILIDPPWSYRDKANAGNRGACYKYETMPMETLKQLPIGEKLAADDACLFLWSTCPMLPEALEVMRAWGFSYRTVAFVWAKRNRKKLDGWFMGCGSYTRANPELCLLGIKGHPKRASAAVHSIIEAPVREHSQKPDEVRDRIVKLCGDVPRIEIFARQRVEGWSSIGIGIDGKRIEDVLEGL